MRKEGRAWDGEKGNSEGGKERQERRQKRRIRHDQGKKST
jgi:hypothetical protein